MRIRFSQVSSYRFMQLTHFPSKPYFAPFFQPLCLLPKSNFRPRLGQAFFFFFFPRMRAWILQVPIFCLPPMPHVLLCGVFFSFVNSFPFDFSWVSRVLTTLVLPKVSSHCLVSPSCFRSVISFPSENPLSSCAVTSSPESFFTPRFLLLIPLSCCSGPVVP